MLYAFQAVLCLLIVNVGTALAAETAQKQIKILGKTISVTQSVSSTSDSGVESTSQVNLFGKKIVIVKSKVEYRVHENEGPSFDHKFYIKGKKILGQSFVNGDGSYAYSADIPYTEIDGDLFSYSLGILTLGIHSGLSYEGELKSEVSSELLKENPAVSPDMNLVKASAGVDLLTKAYVEGQVKVFFVKGAVGGSLNLIDGSASASVNVTPANIANPEIAYDGMVNLLQGKVYGYVGSGNSRFLSSDFYKSKGFCHAFGNGSCPN